MNKPYDVEDVLWQLTSFYKTYMPEGPALEKMLNIYTDLIKFVEYEYRYVLSNTFLPTSQTMYTLPYAKIDITECVYSTHEAFLLRELEFEEIISTLDRKQKYTTFQFNDENLKKAKIVSMVLKTTFTSKEPLKLYDHYFIRDNKLYLMPDFMTQHERVRTHLHALHIKVDENLLEKNWGTRYDVEVGGLVPKNKYRDYLEGLDYTLMSNLTMKEMSEGISKAIGWNTFAIQDMHSMNLSPAKKIYYDKSWIPPAKFIATLPEELIKDKMRLNMLLFLLDEAKQAETDYMLFFDIVRNDPIPAVIKDGRIIHMPVSETGETGDTRRNIFRKWLIEKVDVRYSVKHSTLKTVEETLRHLDSSKLSKYTVGRAEHLWLGSSLLDRYDTNGYYSKNFFYDRNRFVHTDSKFGFDSGYKFDQEIDKPAEMVVIKENSFPRIPRGAEAKRVEGGLSVSYLSNNDGTTKVEVYGVKETSSDMILLGSIDNVSVKEFSSSVFTDVAVDVKSVKLVAMTDSGIKSMMTLEIPI